MCDSTGWNRDKHHNIRVPVSSQYVGTMSGCEVIEWSDSELQTWPRQRGHPPGMGRLAHGQQDALHRLDNKWYRGIPQPYPARKTRSRKNERQSSQIVATTACTLRHGIQNLKEFILACHPAPSTEWMAGSQYHLNCDACAQAPFWALPVFFFFFSLSLTYRRHAANMAAASQCTNWMGKALNVCPSATCARTADWNSSLPADRPVLRSSSYAARAGARR